MIIPQTVLFIDDDQEDLDLLSEATGFIDASIVRLTARNGLEAIRLLTQPGALLPDLIFLDINMPIMNGMECLAELKKIDQLLHIPIVICSTSLYLNNQQEYESLGADFYLVKPDTLIHTVNALQFVFERCGTKRIPTAPAKQLVA